MKAKLEFDLPEEKDELLKAIKSYETVLVIDGILEYIRSQIKYQEDEIKSKHEILEDIRFKIKDLMEEYNITTEVE